MVTKKESRPMGGRQSSARSQDSKAANEKTTRKLTPRQLMHNNAARSDLNKPDCEKLKFKVLTPAQNIKLTGKENNVPGYVIPYFDIHGKPIKNAWRRRNLEIPLGYGGAVRSDPGKWRYTGPKGELPHLYFPPNFGNWAAQAKDVTEPIYITEGEKKAACMCKFGYAAIAVPGVWGWKSKKHGIDIISDFKQVDWGDNDNPRPVIMVFDNDVSIKAQVLGALNALSRKLVGFGSEIFIKHLPEGPLKGIDDFLVAKGADAFDALTPVAFSESGALWEFSERCAFIDNQNFVYDLKTRRNYSSTQRLEFTFANDKMLCFNAAGDEVLKKTCTQWLEWEHRRQYDDLVFSPGEGAVVNGCINTWPGWGCEPVEGDVAPYYKLLDFVFDGEPALKEYFLKWLAYPLQHPGTKMYQAFLFWSQAQGVGKSFLGLIMGAIYCKTFSEVSKDELISSFNQWRINKQFILGDELTGSDNTSRREADKVKGLITADSFIANQKNQGTYPQDSRENYLLTSNHANAIYMTGQDRRFVVHHVDRPPESEAFYARIDKWMRHDNGPAFLFYHLLNEIDLAGFNPRAHAPETKAKQEMIEASKTALECFADDVVNDPDSVLKAQGLAYGQELFTAALLSQFATQYCERKITKSGVGGALKKVGITRKAVKLTGERVVHLYPVRNTAEWLNKKPSEWKDHYERFERKKKF